MSTASTPDVTRLLHTWSGGSPQASEQLLALIYNDLCRIALYQHRRAKNRIKNSFVYFIDAREL